MTKILFVFGTRPEAIKLCPVIRCLRSRAAEYEVRVCVTAQHREMLDQVLAAFQVAPDHDLDLMRPRQSLFDSTSRILSGLEPVLAAETPDLVLVQGDTTTTFCGALAAFYQGIPVGHVEAGLRTGDPRNPFPEEMNRVFTTRLAAIHFAPTEWAAGNLRREGVSPDSIHVTGNTGIDAVLYVSRALEAGELRGDLPLELSPNSSSIPAGTPPRHCHFPGSADVAATSWRGVSTEKRLILVTAHRRESFGPGIQGICDALKELSLRNDVRIVYPVHPNPNVSEPVRRQLGEQPNISLLPPLDYVSFVDLMRRADIIVTDSGGIQEEGPSLGKPLLVTRDTTERPEAVEAGTVRLVGNDPRRIVEETVALLDDPDHYRAMARALNPYGDGNASGRIADLLLRFC